MTEKGTANVANVEIFLICPNIVKPLGFPRSGTSLAASCEANSMSQRRGFTKT